MIPLPPTPPTSISRIAGRSRIVGLSARRRPARCLAAAVVVTLAAAALVSQPAWGQVIESANDPFNYAIPYPRTRLIHSTDTTKAGTTAYLRAYDPMVLYQLGRDLTQLQFKLEHGAYGQAAALTVPLYVGVSENSSVHGAPARFARDHTASCAMCHSSVYREPGGGQTLASTGGLGRNTTHFFGAGLVEMIGEQVRAEILERYDVNRNGLIDRAEVSEPRPVLIRPTPDAEPIDYGDLAPGPDGVPALNSVFRIWFVDAQGKVLPDVFSFEDERAVAYGLAMAPFGWGRGRALVGGKFVPQGGDSSTLREFFTVAADFHMGVQAFDPTQQGDDPSALGGLAQMSLNGAQQFNLGGSVDRGIKRSPEGLSLDDPDHDGHISELTEGDIDAVEFYLLHTPAPAVRSTARSESGREVLLAIGCTRCHVENWTIEARDEARGQTGDRRMFHLATESRPDPQGVPQLIGQVVRSFDDANQTEYAPAYGEAAVDRVYSDFKHWDVGPAFHERRWDGSLQRVHRTAPLWGVGSTGPYGHSGSFLSLHDVIAAHGGAAQAERDAYAALPEAQRELLLSYLRSLVLFSTDQIPADIDGDRVIAANYQVAGQGVGYERFDARFMFEVPPQYDLQSDVLWPNGFTVPLGLITNVRQTYRLDLPYRIDADGDGFPDAADPTPPPPAAAVADPKGDVDERGSR